MANLGDSYDARRHLLEHVRDRLEQELVRHFEGMPHIDRISFRMKGQASFVKKVEKNAASEHPYREPLVEVEDQVAGRILVFFLDDVETAVARAQELFASPVESSPRAPALDAEFGYESYHEVYSIPSWALPAGWGERADVPHMFELQVRTLFQHAYAEPQHDLAYKPTATLTRDQRRELAWVAASAWGADQAFVRVHRTLEGRERRPTTPPVATTGAAEARRLRSE